MAAMATALPKPHAKLPGFVTFFDPDYSRDLSVRRSGQHPIPLTVCSQDQAMGNSGTISSATILMILIKGLTAGPAVSL